MPLGDSITDGDGSSHGGGYRRELARALAEAGHAVEFVGSVPDPVAGLHHEGHPGWVIDEIAAQAAGWLTRARPTAVLLHLGTNDLDRDVDVVGAPARLGALVDTITETVPGVTVYLASLVPGGYDLLRRRVDAFNAEIPRLVKERAQAGHDVRFVDMAGALSRADLLDDLHPNDQGYSAMARVWFTALTGG